MNITTIHKEPLTEREEDVLEWLQPRLKDAEKALKRGEFIEDASRDLGVSQSSLDNVLGSLVEKRQLARLPGGRYALPESTELATEAWRQPEDEIQVVQCRVVVVCAGDGVVPEQYETLLVPVQKFRRDHHAPVPENGKSGRWYAKVVGDSMVPEFFDGEYVPVELINKPINQVRSSGVYVVYFNGVLELRRVQILSSKRVRLVCTNPSYENEEIALDEGTEIVACARVKLPERDQLIGAMLRKIVQ